MADKKPDNNAADKAKTVLSSAAKAALTAATAKPKTTTKKTTTAKKTTAGNKTTAAKTTTAKTNTATNIITAAAKQTTAAKQPSSSSVTNQASTNQANAAKTAAVAATAVTAVTAAAVTAATVSAKKSKKSKTAKKAKTTKTTKASSAKKPPSKKKKNGKAIFSIILIAVLTVGFLGGLIFFENTIDDALKLRTVEYFVPGDKVSIGALNIHFIDVGQADACLVELPDGKVMLIDAGEDNKDVRNKLDDYMKQVNEARKTDGRREITFFDYAIITHSDRDHVGSMAHILKTYPVETFYRPNEKATRAGYDDPAANPALMGTKHGLWGDAHGEKETLIYMNALKAGYESAKLKEAIVTNPHDDTQNCIKPDIEKIPADHEHYYEVNFYGPFKSKYNDPNNYSPTIIIGYKGRHIALNGDSMENDGSASRTGGERDFAAEVNGAEPGDRYYDLKGDFYADIIKLGHHGSSTSSCAEYLAIVTGTAEQNEIIYIVISVNTEAAAKNKWVHPNPEVLARIAALGILNENVKKTDVDGDIFFALTLYEGETEAWVSGVLFKVTYPVLSGVIRYRNIGIAVIVVLSLILLPTSLIKKTKKRAGI